jgi:hypothetical protein
MWKLTNILPFSIEQTYYIVNNHSWKKGHLHSEQEKYVKYEEMEEYYKSFEEYQKSKYVNKSKRGTAVSGLYFQISKYF